MTQRARSSPSFVSARRLLSTLLAAAVVVSGVPLPARAAVVVEVAHLPTELFVEIGDELLSVSFTDYLAHRADLARGDGAFTLTLRRAANGLRGNGEFLPGDPLAQPIRLLGAEPAPTLRQTWQEVISWTLSRTPEAIQSTIRVGSDRFSMSVPQAVSDGMVDIEVNGTTTRLDRSFLRELDASARGTRGPLGEADYPPELAVASGCFHDAPGFFKAYAVLALISQKISSARGPLVGAAPLPATCLWPCTSCVAGLTAYVGSYFTLIAACSAAIATGGAAAIACIGAFLGHEAVSILMVAACAECAVCLDEPPTSPPQPECDEDEHPCGNECCPDALPGLPY